MALTEKDLFYDVIQQCIEHGVNFKLFNRKSMDKSGGYFDESNMVACFKRPYWIRIFVHESCHLDQMIEKDPLWTDIGEFDDIWSGEWIKKNKKNGKALKAFKKYCALEIDCDTRTLNKIKKYNLDVPLAEHYAESNAYHASYYYFYKREIFYHPNHAPYLHKEICDLFPNDRMMTFEECWQPNKGLGEFFDKYHVSLK